MACRSYSLKRAHAGTPRGRDRDARPAGAAGGPPHRAARGRIAGRICAGRCPRVWPQRLTGAARHRLPPPRQIHPDAAGRRIVGAAASRHVRPHGADAGAAATTSRCTSTWCWRPMTAGGSASSIRAASARWIWCRRTREEQHRLLAELGPEPLDDAFSVTRAVRGAGRQADADQGRAARPEGRRRAGQHLCLRGAVPRPHLAAALGVHGPGRAGQPAGAGDQADTCARRSPPADRRCATMCSRTANWAISSTPGRSMAARASPAPAVPGKPACGGRAPDRAVRAQHVLLRADSAVSASRAFVRPPLAPPATGVFRSTLGLVLKSDASKG